jgi:hypothetical protein
MLEEIVAMIHTDVPSGQLELHIAKYKTECNISAWYTCRQENNYTEHV